MSRKYIHGYVIKIDPGRVRFQQFLPDGAENARADAIAMLSLKYMALSGPFCNSQSKWVQSAVTTRGRKVGDLGDTPLNSGSLICSGRSTHLAPYLAPTQRPPVTPTLPCPAPWRGALPPTPSAAPHRKNEANQRLSRKSLKPNQHRHYAAQAYDWRLKSEYLKQTYPSSGTPRILPTPLSSYTLVGLPVVYQVNTSFTTPILFRDLPFRDWICPTLYELCRSITRGSELSYEASFSAV